jgi:hypothetical protein
MHVQKAEQALIVNHQFVLVRSKERTKAAQSDEHRQEAQHMTDALAAVGDPQFHAVSVAQSGGSLEDTSQRYASLLVI